MDIASVPTQDAATVVHAALIVACGIGSALTLAVLGAAWAAVSPESLGWVSTHASQGFLGLLRLLLLVSVAILLYRLAVTYLHTYRGHRMTRHTLHATDRRRLAGRGRRGYSARHAA